MASSNGNIRRTISIRERNDEDIPGCIEILRHVYADSGYPVNTSRLTDPIPFLKPAGLLNAWVAQTDHNSHVVGQVTVAPGLRDNLAVRVWEDQGNTDPVAVLGRLYVDPEAQGLGAAKLLISDATEWAEAKGFRLVLFVLIKDQIAKALYERLGWIMYGTSIFDYNDGEQMEALCFVSPRREN